MNENLNKKNWRSPRHTLRKTERTQTTLPELFKWSKKKTSAFK